MTHFPGPISRDIRWRKKDRPWLRLINLIHSSDLDDDNKREAVNNYGHATPNEYDILNGIVEIPHAGNQFVGEFFRGAHVRIYDIGARYDDWRTLPSVDTRGLSSHASDGPQYHVDGPLVHTLLFGKFGGWTWVQLERHPLYDLVNIAGHGIDLLKYQFGHSNQGPYGSSGHTERNGPIELSPTLPYVPIDRSSLAFEISRQPHHPGRSPFR